MIAQNEGALKYFINIAEYLNQVSFDDVAICIQDRSKILKYVPGKTIDIGIKDGDPLKEQSVSHQAMVERKKVTKKVGEEVHGIPYVAVSLPLFNEEGEAYASITTITSIDQREKIMETSESLLASVEEISASMEQTSTQSLHLREEQDKISNSVQNIFNSMNDIKYITKTLSDISRQTNILGLNAGIEASRIGKEGKGFMVVAKEVKNLANVSSESSVDIDEKISIVSKSLDDFQEMNEKINKVSVALDEQISDIESTIQHITEIAEDLSQKSQI
ncbi:methyl-accepting chemotaxis protein [Alteribacillus sp. YIM 98480]|uniref:methyl-accepting chemotaxis protein n=1 Tax=Alteribacillus sp. YIM 98480 TaxID=2606599 RepID=UPI00131D3E89|nr:methyl-accepting chemotaxis protein [Alteribacillus sp. YIM 98480]